MRARRSAKFAEYLSTYAILEHIGIHPTTLIEKRDAAVGVGVYVRDACDAGTTLFAVPSRRFCTNSVLSTVGLKCAFHSPSDVSASSAEDSPAELSSSTSATHPLVSGIVSFLTGSPQWRQVAWRLALEQQRSVSPLWGWLQSLPSADELKDQTEAAERSCRVHHTMLLPYYQKGRRHIEEEIGAAYHQLRPDNLMPSYAVYRWAVEVLLSRGQVLPRAWISPQRPAGDKHSTVMDNDASSAQRDDVDSDALEFGVAPFIDLVNAPDGHGRATNAQIEVAASLDDLPPFFVEEMVAASASKGRDGLADLQTLLQTHYYLCLTLQEPLRASEEVIIDWEVPVLSTGVLQAKEDQLISRLLKYKF